MNPHIIYTLAFHGLFERLKLLVSTDGFSLAIVTPQAGAGSIQSPNHWVILGIIVVTCLASVYAGYKTSRLETVTETKHNGPAWLLVFIGIALGVLVYLLFDQYGPRPHPINDPYRPNNLIQLPTNHFYEVFGAGFACALALFAAVWLFIKESRKQHSHTVAATLAFVCAAQLILVGLLLL